MTTITLPTPALQARQLESLVRLAEARARCELRDVVSRADAEDAVEIMEEALMDRWAGCMVGWLDGWMDGWMQHALPCAPTFAS
jgi:hypothetical protein